MQPTDQDHHTPVGRAEASESSDSWVALNRAVASGIHQTSITSIDLFDVMVGNTEWQWLASILPSLDSLKSLALARTGITDQRFAQLFPTSTTTTFASRRGQMNVSNGMFDSSAQLESLDLSQNKLTAKSAVGLGKYLHWMSSTLVSLSIEGNALGDHGLQTLGAYVAKMRRSAFPAGEPLHDVHLGSFSPAKGARRSVSSATRRSSSQLSGGRSPSSATRGARSPSTRLDFSSAADPVGLTSLNVSANAATARGLVEILVKSSHAEQLKLLALNDNSYIVPTPGPKGGESVGAANKRKSKEEPVYNEPVHLAVAERAFRDKWAKRQSRLQPGSAAAGQAANDSVASVNSQSINFFPPSAPKELLTSSPLRCLDLSGCRLGACSGEGVTTIVESIFGGCASLIEVNLSRNALGDEVLVALYNSVGRRAIRANQLEVLDLTGNRMTTNGAFALAAAVEELGLWASSLTWLSLSGNQLSIEGSMALVAAASPAMGPVDETTGRTKHHWDRLTDLQLHGNAYVTKEDPELDALCYLIRSAMSSGCTSTFSAFTLAASPTAVLVGTNTSLDTDLYFTQLSYPNIPALSEEAAALIDLFWSLHAEGHANRMANPAFAELHAASIIRRQRPHKPMNQQSPQSGRSPRGFRRPDAAAVQSPSAVAYPDDSQDPSAWLNEHLGPATETPVAPATAAMTHSDVSAALAALKPMQEDPRSPDGWTEELPPLQAHVVAAAPVEKPVEVPSRPDSRQTTAIFSTTPPQEEVETPADSHAAPAAELDSTQPETSPSVPEEEQPADPPVEEPLDTQPKEHVILSPEVPAEPSSDVVDAPIEAEQLSPVVERPAVVEEEPPRRTPPRSRSPRASVRMKHFDLNVPHAEEHPLAHGWFLRLHPVLKVKFVDAITDDVCSILTSAFGSARRADAAEEDGEDEPPACEGISVELLPDGLMTVSLDTRERRTAVSRALSGADPDAYSAVKQLAMVTHRDAFWTAIREDTVAMAIVDRQFSGSVPSAVRGMIDRESELLAGVTALLEKLAEPQAEGATTGEHHAAEEPTPLSSLKLTTDELGSFEKSEASSPNAGSQREEELQAEQQQAVPNDSDLLGSQDRTSSLPPPSSLLMIEHDDVPWTLPRCDVTHPEEARVAGMAQPLASDYLAGHCAEALLAGPTDESGLAASSSAPAGGSDEVILAVLGAPVATTPAMVKALHSVRHEQGAGFAVGQGCKITTRGSIFFSSSSRDNSVNNRLRGSVQGDPEASRLQLSTTQEGINAGASDNEAEAEQPTPADENQGGAVVRGGIWGAGAAVQVSQIFDQPMNPTVGSNIQTEEDGTDVMTDDISRGGSRAPTPRSETQAGGGAASTSVADALVVSDLTEYGTLDVESPEQVGAAASPTTGAAPSFQSDLLDHPESGGGEATPPLQSRPQTPEAAAMAQPTLPPLSPPSAATTADAPRADMDFANASSPEAQMTFEDLAAVRKVACGITNTSGASADGQHPTLQAARAAAADHGLQLAPVAPAARDPALRSVAGILQTVPGSSELSSADTHKIIEKETGYVETLQGIGEAAVRENALTGPNFPKERRNKTRVTNTATWRGVEVTISVEWDELLVIKQKQGFGAKAVIAIHPLIGGVKVARTKSPNELVITLVQGGTLCKQYSSDAEKKGANRFVTSLLSHHAIVLNVLCKDRRDADKARAVLEAQDTAAKQRQKRRVALGAGQLLQQKAISREQAAPTAHPFTADTSSIASATSGHSSGSATVHSQ